MKKKDFLVKVTTVDFLLVSVLLIAGLTVPIFQNLMTSLFYKPWIYGILCMNLVIDLLLLIQIMMIRYTKNINIQWRTI